MANESFPKLTEATLRTSRSFLRLRRRSPARRRHRGQGDFPLQARKMYICAMLAGILALRGEYTLRPPLGGQRRAGTSPANLGV